MVYPYCSGLFILVYSVYRTGGHTGRLLTMLAHYGHHYPFLFPLGNAYPGADWVEGISLV